MDESEPEDALDMLIHVASQTMGTLRHQAAEEAEMEGRDHDEAQEELQETPAFGANAWVKQQAQDAKRKLEYLQKAEETHRGATAKGKPKKSSGATASRDPVGSESRRSDKESKKKDKSERKEDSKKAKRRSPSVEEPKPSKKKDRDRSRSGKTKGKKMS